MGGTCAFDVIEGSILLSHCCLDRGKGDEGSMFPVRPRQYSREDPDRMIPLARQGVSVGNRAKQTEVWFRVEKLCQT
jgi:hypothetical protein